MSSVFVVIFEIGFQDSPQVSFIEDDHVFEAVTPDRADHPFNEWVLPGASICGDHLSNAHAFYAFFEIIRAVLCLTITRQNIQNRTLLAKTCNMRFHSRNCET